LPQDAYTTPARAVAPLLTQLPPRTAFVEPCAGEGRLIAHLTAAGHILAGSYDLPHDARIKRYRLEPLDVFITNPPWDRPVLHAIIENLSNQAPSWLLIDFDWLATVQAAPLLPRLRKIIVIGRVKWIPDSPHTGKDNCCWCLFTRPSAEPAIFIGRQAAIPMRASSLPIPIDEAPVIPDGRIRAGRLPAFEEETSHDRATAS
jgi:hypothetical protein